MVLKTPETIVLCVNSDHTILTWSQLIQKIFEMASWLQTQNVNHMIQLVSREGTTQGFTGKNIVPVGK